MTTSSSSVSVRTIIGNIGSPSRVALPCRSRIRNAYASPMPLEPVRPALSLSAAARASSRPRRRTVSPAPGPAGEDPARKRVTCNDLDVVIDWDGTATERDTLLLALEHFVDPAVLGPIEAELDAKLAAGTLTHREVMEREFELLRAPLDDVVAFLLEHARVRPGFAGFVGRF